MKVLFPEKILKNILNKILPKTSKTFKHGLNCNWTEYVSAEGNFLEPYLYMVQCGMFIEMVLREYHGSKLRIFIKDLV